MLILYAAVSALSLDHDFHEEVKGGQESELPISLTSSFRGHHGLAKHCTS